MIIFIFLILSFADSAELSSKKTDRDANFIRQPRQQLVDPIWPDTSPTSLGYTAEVHLYYGAYGAYYVEAGIGSPPKPYRMLLSSTAEFSAVKSSRCDKCFGSVYDGDESDTVMGWSNDSNSEVGMIDTLGGRYVGSFIKDRVMVGDFTTYKVKMIAMMTGSNMATQGDHDGILSLRYELGDRGYFQRLTQYRDQIKKPIVTFIFYKERHNKVNDRGGIMWIGTRDPDYYHDPMAFSFINSPYWVVGLQNFTMEGVEFCRDGPCLGHINIEEEFVLVNQTIYNAILGLMKGAKYDNLIMVDCEKRSSVPPIIFEIGAEKFILSGDEYVIQNGEECFAIFKLDTHIRELEFVLGTYFHQNFVLEFGLYKHGKAISKGIGLAKRKLYFV